MALDPAALLGPILGLSKRVISRRAVAYVPVSATITAPFKGYVVVRAMGAGGSGSRGNFASGGNGATVAIKRLAVSAGGSISVVIPGGGAAQTVASSNGNQGGTLSVSVGAWTGTIPGGNGGVQGVSLAKAAANTAPTGWDEYWLGGLGAGMASNDGGGGGAAPLLLTSAVGVSNANNSRGGAGVGGAGFSTFGGGSGGPAISSLNPGPNLFFEPTNAVASVGEEHSRVLVNCSGGGGNNTGTIAAGPGGGGGGGNSTAATRGGFGGGGGGGATSYVGGAGGIGGGGGGSGTGTSGAGGDGWVTLEFEEAT